MRPCRGVTSREVQGVRMRPINTSPASVAAGGSIVTSDSRTSFSRTIVIYSTSILIMPRTERPPRTIVRLKLGAKQRAHGEARLTYGCEQLLIADEMQRHHSMDLPTPALATGARTPSGV